MVLKAGACEWEALMNCLFSLSFQAKKHKRIMLYTFDEYV